VLKTTTFSKCYPFLFPLFRIIFTGQTPFQNEYLATVLTEWDAVF